MNKLPATLSDVFRYGSGALPALNQVISYSSVPSEKFLAFSLYHIWKGDYKKAMVFISKALKTCKSQNARMFLLGRLLSCKAKMGEFDEKLYTYLKTNLRKTSGNVREELEMLLLNIASKYSEGVGATTPPRIWGKEKTSSAVVFHHIGLARDFSRKGDLADSVHHFVKACRIASSIPHPSGIITALNGIAWDIRKRHTKFAYKFAKTAVYYLGFFREDFGNLTGVLDSLFDIENRMKLQEIYKTAIVISCLKLPDRYKKLKERAKQLLPPFSENTYKNTRKLRNFLKKILGPYRSESLSPSRTSEIVTGKTSFIRSDTLQKLIEGKDIDIYTCPYPVYNELIKKRIKKDFEKSIMTLQDMKFKDRLCLFLSTFTALVDRSKFYLSRKDKFIEAFVLLKRKKDIPRFKEYMSKRYETMLFVINMIEPHPYIKGRRDAAKKFFSRLSSKKLETFAKVYANLSKGNRKVMDRFLRNYGRYEVMRLRTRLKGPQVIREFAKRYRARVQPAFAAYWAESDGRVRRHVEYLAGRFV